MVWGLAEPHVFGDCFPDGEYVGFDEALESYMQTGMPEDERQRMENLLANYAYEVSQKFVYDKGPLLAHECPVAFQTEQNYTKLASLLVLNNGLLAVDGQLKAVVESLEPGVHQFWPLTITMPHGFAYPVQYYGLRIGQFRDSCVPEESQVRISTVAPMYFALGRSKKDFAAVAVSKAAIGGAHLWRETKLQTPDILMSDTLQSEIAKRGLRIFKHYKLKEV
jgi:hypothetical protein